MRKYFATCTRYDITMIIIIICPVLFFDGSDSDIIFHFYLDACTGTKCDHYAMCELGVDGSSKCVCPKIKNCPAIVKPVCGSNGKSYINECRLKIDSCKKRKKILVKKEGICGKVN